MTGRSTLLFAPAGLAGLGAAIAIGGTSPLAAVAWLGAGAALALSLRSAPAPGNPPLGELERHLARCRRRGERAYVLVAMFASPPGALARCFRLTDSVGLMRTRAGHELAGVFDEAGLDRAVLERRLRASAGPVAPAIAWKRFPDDGVTLQALLDGARAALHTDGAVEQAPVVAPVIEAAPAAAPLETK